MQSIYQSSDKKLNVEIPFDIIEAIKQYSDTAGRNETGGILIGNYNNSHDTAQIKNVTGPPADSKSGRNWFYRGLKNLQTKLNEYWNKKQYYLGEWHYHPYSSPSPSTVDTSQMFKIAISSDYRCPEPVMLIIGGSRGKYQIAVFVFVRSDRMIELKMLPQVSHNKSE
ncbi:MAG: Mov34/MPN/PAD-1 family protein [Candidatus Pseudobacter hemicellulosilyticus]|uniref:Mov34/MPN/PAD-1 family protein n=1 Tax=Candidatus Pseudobacter hemicellulosilyticus TaxID=3121375 RepID=A0AAJ5WSV6_9BACT|nr:MAG: Mov34/MPN/PAD-1 family protein [Pseudobacter sp.]